MEAGYYEDTRHTVDIDSNWYSDKFLNRTEELKHSYDKFRFVGKVDKPVFEEVYSSVKEYISEIIKA